MREEIPIVWADVIALAPELEEMTISAQDDILAQANSGLDPRVFGGNRHPKYRLARIYYAAHLAAISSTGASGASGPITSESVGGVSRSYGTSSGTTSIGYDASAYGRQLQELINTSIARLPLVI